MGRCPLARRDAKCQHAGVGVGQGLARAEYVEEPQRDRLDAVGFAEDHHGALLRIFRQRIDRRKIDPLLLVGRDRNEHAAFIGYGFPKAGFGARLFPAHVFQPAPVVGQVQSLAVDAHGGGHDDTLDALLDDLLEENGRTEVIGPDIAGDLVHRLPDADFGGEMNQAVDALQGARDRLAVAHVADDEFGRARQVRARRAMHLVDQGIEDSHLVPAVEQFLRHVTADEAPTPSHQDSFHRSSFSRWLSGARTTGSKVCSFAVQAPRRTKAIRGCSGSRMRSGDRTHDGND